MGLSIRLHAFEIVAPLPDAREIATYVLSLGMILHLLWRVIADAKGDLLRARRSARALTVVTLGVLSIVVGIAEITLAHEVQSFIRALIILPLAMLAHLLLAPLQFERLSFVGPAQEPSAVNEALNLLSDKQEEQLKVLMEDERVFLQHGLTVSTLAGMVGVPEHRLRAYINQQTGYRNFASYINFYRLNAAKAVLRDPEQQRTPIITVALDAGFASLATFNRVFKTVENQTPSEYRKAHLQKRSD